MCRFVFIFVLFLSFISGACKQNSQEQTEIKTAGPAMVVSISSDGRYAISSHQDKRLVLWDLKNLKKNIISDQANIYSAYFVPGQDAFLWQDLENVVYYQKVDGKIAQSFSHFPTYGHILSPDLKKYVSSDQDWNIYLGHGESLKPIKKDGESPGFIGVGKLLNLTFTPDSRYLLSAGDSGFGSLDNLSLSDHPPVNKGQIFSNYAGVLLWDISTKFPVYRFPGNAAKTTATLSPGGKYTVSGCENGNGFVWDNQTGNQIVRLASLYHGILEKNDTDDYEKWTRDKTGLIPPPEDLDSNEATMALKFINGKNYLRFLTYSPYAVLYDIDSPLPLKYLPLGRDPFPAVSDYSRNAAIDSAPDAGIVVTGQRDGGGIIVYKYNAEKQDLEKIWTGD